jgi:glycosyltransferase involved in cell wall biosynthesis
MRRILIFSLAYYPAPVAGAEVAVKEIADRIQPPEIEFDLITLNGGNQPRVEKIGNVTVHRLFRRFGAVEKFLYPFFAFFKALSLHKKNKYDETWAIMASFAGFAAFLFKKVHPEVPFVLTIQEGENFQRRQGLFNPFFKWIFKSADQISVISNFLADWAKSMGARCPITLVPNAVDYESFSKSVGEDVKKQIRSQLNVSPDETVLVTSSRLVYKNAVDNVIEALPLLDKSVKFLILGAGPDEKKIKDQVTKLRLEDRVIFKGYVDHRELPKYLQSSDIFIRPSRSEGLGNSFLEAMAAGIPVIATKVGGIPDFLIEGETGLYCEVNNPRSIAQKVEKLIKDAESREFIVNKAREMVRERYGWDSIAKKMKEVLMLKLNS